MPGERQLVRLDGNSIGRPQNIEIQRGKDRGHRGLVAVEILPLVIDVVNQLGGEPQRFSFDLAERTKRLFPRLNRTRNHHRHSHADIREWACGTSWAEQSKHLTVLDRDRFQLPLCRSRVVF